MPTEESHDVHSWEEVKEGNLSSHLQRMEDAGCVGVEKEFVDRKPQTTYELTPLGREKFEEHVQTLELLLDQVED